MELCLQYEVWLLCSETNMSARAEALHVKSLREQACQSQNIITGPSIAVGKIKKYAFFRLIFRRKDIT